MLGGKAVLAVKPGSTLDRLLDLSGLGEFLRVEASAEAALRRLGATIPRAFAQCSWSNSAMNTCTCSGDAVGVDERL